MQGFIQVVNTTDEVSREESDTHPLNRDLTAERLIKVNCFSVSAYPHKRITWRHTHG